MPQHAAKQAPNTVRYPEIKRRAKLCLREFRRDFKARRRPVVLTDATADWRAHSKWGFDFFRREYSDTSVTVSRYDGQWYRASDASQMRLGQFIDGLLSKDWRSFPFYIRDYWGLFEAHPELLGDCKPPAYFFDWFERLPRFMRRPGPRFFMGPKGAITPLHVDIWSTHAWLTQIEGRKRWILIPPKQQSLLESARVQAPGLKKFRVDPESEEFARQFPGVQPIECTLSPGETIFVPSGWLHHVISLDAGISVTWNFMGPGCFFPVLPLAVNDLVFKRILRRSSH